MNTISKFHIDSIFIFIIGVAIFGFIVHESHTDIPVHIKQALNIKNGEASYPPNFLFYLLVNIFSGISTSFKTLAITGIIILAIALSIKYYATKSFLIQGKATGNNQAIIISIMLIFCTCFQDPYNLLVLDQMYLGRAIPNVWHNSTSILLFPFTILLFWQFLKTFSKDFVLTKSSILILLLLVILNAIIKPSFLFVFIPILGLSFIYFIKNNKYIVALSFMFVGIISCLLILSMHFLIFEEQVGSFQKTKSKVALSGPFQVLRYWVPDWYLPISIASSYFFSIMTAIFYKTILKYKPFLLALIMVVISLFISGIFMETGPRKGHGNFTWQNIFTSYILLLVTIKYLLKNHSLKEWKLKILSAVFTLQFCFGIYYVLRLLFTKQYF